MSVLEDWQAARPLPAAAADLVRRLVADPAAELCVTLPVPPGINGWWEPVALRRRGRVVASLRLTKAATAYKHLAERTLLEAGPNPPDLHAGFHHPPPDPRVTPDLA